MKADISCGQAQPDQTIDRPIFWEPSLAFMKYATAFILVGCITFLIALVIFAPDQTARALAVLMLMLMTVVVRFLVSRHRMEAAVRTLGIGVWTYVSVTSFFLGGVSSTSFIIYPLIILLLGWLVGTRTAVAVALLTAVTSLVFVLAESWGFLPVPPPTAPAMRWVIQCTVFVLSAVLIAHVVHSYRNRLAEVRRLSGDLAQRTAELQAREDDLNRAQAVAHVGSWVYDLAADTMRLSAETCRIFGLPVGTTGSHDTYLSRVHPEDRGPVDGAWQAALKGGEPFDNEHRIMVGKTIRWVRQIAELEFGADGTPLRSVGTTRDITEYKRYEAEILAARSQLAATLDAVPDLLFEVGLDGRFHDYHSPRREFLFAPPEDFLGKRISDILPPDAADISMSALHEAHEKGVSKGKQYELQLPQGKLWFELSLSRKPVEPGHEPRFIVLSRDITERKRLEEALRAQTERLLIGQRAARMVIMDWDLPNNEISWSDSPEWLRGPLPEGGKYPRYLEQVHPEDRDRFLAVRTEGIDTLRPHSHEYRIVRTDGRVLWIRSERAVLPGADGKPARMIAALQDVSQRKQAEAARAQLEAQLRESQKMEALGTLAGGIAHDFNNIVAAIMGNVELARQDVGPAHAALESLEEIRKASQRAKQLVQQILAFGRRQVLERKPISLAPVVEESARLLRATLPAGVSLNIECAPDAAVVLADATQIQQVMLNVCSNAWQAMQGRPGVIEVRLEPHVHVPGEARDAHFTVARGDLRPGSYVCLTVRDNGSGMDEQTLARIFEPFFTTKPVDRGTGLGLAVVHGILQEHGASIQVRSAPNEGTTFRIYFPAVEAPAGPTQESTGREQDRHAPRAEHGDAPALRGDGKHILYVDDDESIVFLMTRLLERQGYRVSGYTDAREAIAAVRCTPDRFDLAVTDYNMPGMSGLEVARALRAIRDDLPVAIASGYITEELRAMAPAAGARDLIYKPNTVDELCEVVARLARTPFGKESSS